MVWKTNKKQTHKKGHIIEGEEGRNEHLRGVGVQTVDFCEHFTGMFRVQVLNRDGSCLNLHKAQEQPRRSYKVLSCHGLVSEDGFTRSRI